MFGNKELSLSNECEQDKTFSRRRWLKRVAVGAGAVGATAVLSSAEQALFKGFAVINEVKKLRESNYSILEPGYIESEIYKKNSKVEFFGKHGHIDYLKTALEVPLIAQIVKKHIEFNIDSFQNNQKYISVGHALSHVLATTAAEMSKSLPVPLAVDNPQVVHIGILAAAAIFNHNLFNHMCEVNPLGLSQDKNERLWDTKNVYPNVLPGNTKDFDPANGPDRAEHTFNHMFLAESIVYSRQNNLPQFLNVTAPLDLITVQGMMLSPQRAAVAFCNTVGAGYELETTFRGDELQIGPDTQSGIFDPFVLWDMCANNFGARCGVGAATGHINQVLDIMRDPRIAATASSPSLPANLDATLDSFVK